MMMLDWLMAKLGLHTRKSNNKAQRRETRTCPCVPTWLLCVFGVYRFQVIALVSLAIIVTDAVIK